MTKRIMLRPRRYLVGEWMIEHIDLKTNHGYSWELFRKSRYRDLRLATHFYSIA